MSRRRGLLAVQQLLMHFAAKKLGTSLKVLLGLETVLQIPAQV